MAKNLKFFRYFLQYIIGQTRAALVEKEKMFSNNNNNKSSPVAYSMNRERESPLKRAGGRSPKKTDL